MNLHWIEAFEGQRTHELYALYCKEWWTQGRTFDEMTDMLVHSDLVLGCCSDDGQLVGFARVLTDYTFKALIFDVIIDEDFRGHGLGQSIVNRIINHETLSRVRSFELYCPERLVPFYEKLGFAKGTSLLLRHQR